MLNDSNGGKEGAARLAAGLTLTAVAPAVAVLAPDPQAVYVILMAAVVLLGCDPRELPPAR